MPFALGAGSNAGDTTGATSVIPGGETSCAGDGNAPEQVWRFDAPTPGILALTLTPDAWVSVLHARAACATSSSALGCDPLTGQQTENQLTLTLGAAGPVDVIVDGDDASEAGAYVLEAAFTQVVCGDGAVTGGEACDGTTVPGSCVAEGFVGGTLACEADCTYDTSGCLTQICGNGAIEGNEQCDGTNFGTRTCANYVFEGGSLTCNNCTTISTASCTSTCGSGFLTANEACDDGNLAAGDGCSSTCTVASPTLEQEAPDTATPDNDDGAPNTLNAGDGPLVTNDFDLARFNGPFSSTILIQGSMNVAGDEDAFQITNSTSGTIAVRVQTQGPAGLASCPGDTVLTVRDGAGAVVGSPSDDSFGTVCSALVVNLPAGVTAFVIVSDFEDNSAFGPYLLQLDFP
ncbi:MAG: hypothetical protein A2138_02795 [Deltaproteobacteria bacterium RBG_16_71_12]|nr:MAG: hypothetical protein A2138_02795 [Deltaproteobacteria bacterium RBG_16_71_12]